MKKLFILTIISVLSLGFFISPVNAKTISVKGYYKSSTGKYVMPSYRTSPNKTKLDNYSTKGNYNPFTGKKGYVSPFRTFKFK